VEVGEKVVGLTFPQMMIKKMAIMIFWKKIFQERWKTKSPLNALTTSFMMFWALLFPFFSKKKFSDFGSNIWDLDIPKKLKTMKNFWMKHHKILCRFRITACLFLIIFGCWDLNGLS
jgi:hypothetical protein